MLCQQLDQSGLVSENVHRPLLDLGQDPWVEILDLERHLSMFAYALTFVTALKTSNAKVCDS